MVTDSKKVARVGRPKKSKPNRIGAFLSRVWSITVRTVLFVLLIAFIVALVILSLWLLSLFNWSHFDFRILLGYVQALAWPAVVTVVLIVLKKEVVALLNRIKSASVGDKKVEFEPQAVNQSLAPQSPMLEDVVENSDESPEDSFEKIYSLPGVQLAFERIYRNIFGTQLQALNFLAANSESVTSFVLNKFYERHIELLHAENNFSDIHQYLAYLVINGLVSHDETTDTYQIVHPFGPFFLRYLAEQGISDPSLKHL